jgi:hypothetical protein
LVRVAFGPSLLALIVIAAVTLVQLVVANSDLTGTLGAVASMWLAVHLVPVSIDGQQLGALPLVPAALMVWATARSTAQITPPRGSWFVIRWIVSSAVGGPLLIAAVALAVVHDAASVIAQLQTPNALGAFAGVLAVQGLGALIGVGSRIGPRLWGAIGVPRWVNDAVRPALIGIATLLALSSAVVALSLMVHWGTMQDLFALTDSFFGQLSLTILSLLYLPNVVLGAAAVAVGSSAHIGFATFSAFTAASSLSSTSLQDCARQRGALVQGSNVPRWLGTHATVLLVSSDTMATAPTCRYMDEPKAKYRNSGTKSASDPRRMIRRTGTRCVRGRASAARAPGAHRGRGWRAAPPRRRRRAPAQRRVRGVAA